MSNDYLIWLIIFCMAIILLGLYISDFTALDLNQKEDILKNNNNNYNYNYNNNYYYLGFLLLYILFIIY